MDFGSNEHIAEFPMLIGNWRGTGYETAKVEQKVLKYLARKPK